MQSDETTVAEKGNVPRFAFRVSHFALRIPRFALRFQWVEPMWVGFPTP